MEIFIGIFLSLIVGLFLVQYYFDDREGRYFKKTIVLFVFAGLLVWGLSILAVGQALLELVFEGYTNMKTLRLFLIPALVGTVLYFTVGKRVRSWINRNYRP